ncbi:MAG: hypothetical protein KGP34_00505 [Bacteroidetes bacterium]|nr:hypothetical protein [Bacteroidota bacterium]
MLFGARASLKLIVVGVSALFMALAPVPSQSKGNPDCLNSQAWSLFCYFEWASSGFTEKEYHGLMAKAGGTELVPLAYRGAYRGLAVPSMEGTVQKYQGAKAAVEDLNRAVSEEPANPRWRLLRWVLEREIPAWLGLSKHKAEDKAFLDRARAVLRPEQIRNAGPKGDLDWVFFLGKVQ